MERRKGRIFQSPAGSRIKHLKKPDGEPLWRVDIQFDFLNAVLQDQNAVFTNSHTGEKQTFAELYLDAMARSSKCSSVLAERLCGGGQESLKIAMVCILVNIGRMNTTLNFFPEMKAQLRTYHPIPSLQSGDQLEYKQLQDAPRLKSILKGACDQKGSPETLDELMALPAPRTNPINLIFLLAASFVDVEARFFAEHKFSDLIMGSQYSSASRAQAFLWLCWTCLESDFSGNGNPFGQDTRAPALVQMTESEIAAENVDPQEEVSFGNYMLNQRLKYLDGGSKSTSKQVALATYPSELILPPQTTPRERRTIHEFRKLVWERRVLERRRRHMFKVHKTWSQMRDVDPIFDSDTETKARHEPAQGLAVMGYKQDSNGDHGEFFATMSRVLRKTREQAQALVPAAADVPPAVQPL